jgi:hypothetical protein
MIRTNLKRWWQRQGRARPERKDSVSRLASSVVRVGDQRMTGAVRRQLRLFVLLAIASFVIGTEAGCGPVGAAYTNRWVNDNQIRALAKGVAFPLYVPRYVPQGLSLSMAQETPFPNGSPTGSFIEISFGQGRLILTEDTHLQTLYSGMGSEMVSIFPLRGIRGVVFPISGEWNLQVKVPPVMLTMQTQKLPPQELVMVARSLVRVPR